jgi:hypothetical protein
LALMDFETFNNCFTISGLHEMITYLFSLSVPPTIEVTYHTFWGMKFGLT